jgi:hypothetical protein
MADLRCFFEKNDLRPLGAKCMCDKYNTAIVTTFFSHYIFSLTIVNPRQQSYHE